MADDPINPSRHDADRVAPQSSGADHRAATTDASVAAPVSSPRGASTQVEAQTAPDDHPQQEAWLGTDSPRRRGGNTAWGAIIAGVITFLALLLLLGMGAAALGLQDGSATAVGIWTLIGLVISFIVGGYVAGALAVRGGLLHGFLTWATSLIAVLILAGWLGTSVLGAFGSVAGTVAESAGQAVNVTSEDAQGAGEAVDEQEAEQTAQQAQDQASEAADQAQQTAEEVAPEAGEGTWWVFGGLLVGAVLSSLAGVAGSRSVINKRTEFETDGATRS